jgi:4-amino-4-deoxy-L-arabinose transferase-like glycosyltransferase
MDPEPVNRNAVLIFLALVLLVGILLRLPPALFAGASAPLRSLAILHPNPKWSEMGFVGPDEGLYRDYLEQLIEKGIGRYPEIVRGYREQQENLSGAILPPVRFLYIFAGYIWHLIFNADALASLRNVASLFSIFTLGLAAVLGWRMHGPVWSVALTALVAFAPTQLHMSQHGLIDGFFAFWALLALWLLWENLQSPRRWSLLAAYAAALALLVLTKESSVFVWIGIVVILATNRWLPFGQVSSELLVATILGPIVGVIALTIIAGGVNSLFHTYQLFVTKNYSLPYQVRTGDGPWQRYLVDLLLVSPVVLILAIGYLFRIDRRQRAELFLVLFVAGTYAVMCNVKYGMNLRFANMWDVPLCFLALAAIVRLIAPFQQRRNLVLAVAIAFICALEIRQYQILFVEHSLHELASEGLFRALNILK